MRGRPSGRNGSEGGLRVERPHARLARGQRRVASQLQTFGPEERAVDTSDRSGAHGEVSLGAPPKLDHEIAGGERRAPVRARYGDTTQPGRDDEREVRGVESTAWREARFDVRRHRPRDLAGIESEAGREAGTAHVDEREGAR